MGATPSQGAQAISGKVSLNGLNTTTIFTAPAAGVYFVNGQLSLPHASTTGGGINSAVVVVVKKNASTVYTGTAGATGFQIPQQTLASGDVVSTVLTSAAAPDQVLNAVTGQVYFGNVF